MEFINLKKENVLKIGIKNEEGVETGEHLVFDLEDVELPLRLNDCDKIHRENIKFLQNSFVILDKKQDKKGKYLLSYKEEEKLKLLKEFYVREEKALDLFIGEGGTKKLLNGRKPYYTMYDDINEMLEPILPLLEKSFTSISDKIKKKYTTKSDENVLK